MASRNGSADRGRELIAAGPPPLELSLNWRHRRWWRPKPGPLGQARTAIDNAIPRGGERAKTSSTEKCAGTRPHPTWVVAAVPPYRNAYKRTRHPTSPTSGCVGVCGEEMKNRPMDQIRRAGQTVNGKRRIGLLRRPMAHACRPDVPQVLAGPRGTSRRHQVLGAGLGYAPRLHVAARYQQDITKKREKTQRRNFTSHRRCGEWGSNNLLKGRRKRGMGSRNSPAL